jgi:uncharacterized protein
MILTTTTAPWKPVAAGRRILEIDILRGVAILGVLAADMIGFSSPEIHFGPSLMWTDAVSRATAFLLDVLVSEKFLTLFSILFGLGFAMQMERATGRGASFGGFYVRRLFLLFLIGLVHGLFFWAGDILTTYAVLGLLLLLFRCRTQKATLGWAIGIQALVLLAATAASLLGGKREGMAGEELKMIDLYGHGTWAAIQQARVADFMVRHVSSLPLLLLFIFPRFLFGLWLWRTGILRNLADHKPLLRRVCVWGIVIGTAGEAATALLQAGDMGPLRVICIPLLALGYASGIVLFALGNRWLWLQQAFAAVGRTALSNYLFQRILCTTLFYSYGLGWYGKIGPLSGLALTVAIYAAQTLLTAWWMRRFQYGPLEWIWRCFSYLEIQSMRV